jgi:predicted membrane channel-forming protein YqfA (hemolysin III family)
MSENRIDEAALLLGLSSEEQEKLHEGLMKNNEELTREEAKLVIEAGIALGRNDAKANYKKRSLTEREQDHERVSNILGGYTAFIAAALLTMISADRGNGYDVWAISFWFISLPYLCGALLIDFRIKVEQKRKHSKILSYVCMAGLLLSHIGNTAIIASFSWLAAMFLLLSIFVVGFLTHEVTVLGGNENFEDL